MSRSTNCRRPPVADSAGFVVVVPARYGSTRLPGKPLLDICGKPMVQRVWEQCRRSDAERVVVATDDPRIADACAGFGAEVCMTSPDHPSGTDRLEEVTRRLELAPDCIVVNVQGDEPRMPPALIRQVAANLAAHPEAGVSTLCEPLESLQDVNNPNIVKVIADCNGMALYFSRAPIPWARDAFAAGAPELPGGWRWMRHIGIYGYRVELLREFVRWQACALEGVECLEQLRVLFNGRRIHVDAAVEMAPGGVDTQADLERVRAGYRD